MLKRVSESAMDERVMPETAAAAAPAPRRKTVPVKVGKVAVGAGHPIVVQSMTNTDTADVAATVQQVSALARAGSELVRITVNNEEAAAAVPAIVEGLDRIGIGVPIIGDFHYNGHLLLTRYPGCARALAKYRINPGNVGGKRHDENFRAIIEVAIAHGKQDRKSTRLNSSHLGISYAVFCLKKKKYKIILTTTKTS